MYCEIEQVIFGLLQGGIITNDLLIQRLEPHGYYQKKHTLVLVKHKWSPIIFSLFVDNFVVKYVCDTNKRYYELTSGWVGVLYCGTKLDWEYRKRTFNLTTPGCIGESLYKYQHILPKGPNMHHTN